MRRLKLVLVILIPTALVACSGRKRAECSAMMDALTPVSEAAHAARGRYDPQEIARYARVVAEAKTKIEALTITDEKLVGIRVDVVKMLDMNLTVMKRLEAGPQASSEPTRAMTPAEVKEKSVVLEALKTYCQ